MAMTFNELCKKILDVNVCDMLISAIGISQIGELNAYNALSLLKQNYDGAIQFYGLTGGLAQIVGPIEK